MTQPIGYTPPQTWEDHFRERAAIAIFAGFGETGRIHDAHNHQVMAAEAVARAEALLTALSNPTNRRPA